MLCGFGFHGGAGCPQHMPGRVCDDLAHFASAEWRLAAFLVDFGY